METPFALSCQDLLRTGKHLDLVNAKLDPSSYADSETFMRDYVAVNLLSKFPNFDIGVDRDKVALDKFLESERSCEAASKRLIDLRRGRIKFSSSAFSDVSSARRKIARLLGPFSWDLASQSFGFGPGASIGINRRQGDSWYKFGSLKPTTTKGNAVLARCAIDCIPLWRCYLQESNSSENTWDCLQAVPGNRVTTVPKNAKTNRVIAIEPLMNMYIQKGIGGLLRRCLKRVGVNLDSQELNQELSLIGSVDGSLATIDLSAASDSISLTLVEELLPEDWVEAIKLCRSPVGVLPDGSLINYKKVSSMGNGYTFELESLIFWALAKCAVEAVGEVDRRIAVYGDDIVIPVSAYDRLVETLEFCGFKTNQDKSFKTGPFRESCGKHYFLGRDVTPIYIRNSVDNTEAVLVLANNIRRLAHRHLAGGWGCESRYYMAWKLAVSSLPPSLRRPRIPFQSRSLPIGDGALIGNFDEAAPKRARHGLDGYSTKILSRLYKPIRADGVPRLLRELNLLERRPDVGLLDPSPPGGVGREGISSSRYKLGFVKTLVPRWEDVGPWVHELLLATP
jgi:hypothetical protein